MEEDDGVLQFHASSGDLQRALSEREVSLRNLQQSLTVLWHSRFTHEVLVPGGVRYFWFLRWFVPQLKVQEFDITKSLNLKNPLATPLHFRLGTQPPFTVLRPRPRVRTSSSSNSQTGDRDSLVLQPQNIMQVRWGKLTEVLMAWVEYRGRSFVMSCLWILGESGVQLLSGSSGPCGPGRWGRPSWGDVDPRCQWAEEAEVPAKPPDSLQQQQPAGQTLEWIWRELGWNGIKLYWSHAKEIHMLQQLIVRMR